MNVRSIFLTVALVLSACRGEQPSTRATKIILISIDTLRSDHLPAYGYTGVQTPHIDRFRGDSVLFERAYAHVPLVLGPDGAPGDRRFYLVDERGRLMNGKHVGLLPSIDAHYLADDGELSLTFPGGAVVSATVELV